MLISDTHNFIYLKTGKTGSTAVEQYFLPYATNIAYLNHHTSALTTKKIAGDRWEKYFKFCVIRNPFDKIVSTFFYFNKVKNDTVTEFRNWVKDENTKLLFDRNMYLKNSTICVDKFIRYEYMANDLSETCSILGIDYNSENLKVINRGTRDMSYSIVELYDTETIKLVKKIYDFELEYFNYSINDFL